MTIGFAISLFFLRAPFEFHVAIYGASVTTTVIVTTMAALLFSLQFTLERSRLLGLLSIACLFEATLSLLWLAGFPTLILMPNFEAERANMLTWLWLLRNAIFPLLLLAAAWHPTEHRLNVRPLWVLAGPVIGAAVLFYGALWALPWLPTFQVPPDDLRDALLVIFEVGVNAGCAVAIVYRSRLTGQLMPWLWLASVSQTFKVSSIALLAARPGFGWYLVSLWGMAGPCLVATALLWYSSRSYRSVYQQNQRLFTLATTDQLTALFNRVYFEQQLSRDLTGVGMGGAGEAGAPLSLLLLDVDFFKTINDRYGHLVGDRVLQKMSRLIEGATRQTGDFVARIGGEEFAIVLNGASERAACQVAERLREAVASYPNFIDDAFKPIQMTISIGVAVVEVGQNRDLESVFR
ncbi:MAG: diguanylate cyclase domain-containing protein, partial [Janthinobacterium lividum]